MTMPDAPLTSTADERSERTVEVQGIPTHLFEAGSLKSPPLLYLHGTFLGNLWLDYHRALAQHFHLFAPDIPGFGLTPRPEWTRDMSDYILYFRDLLDVLELEKVHLVGHSLGGWMAVEVAIWYPERVQRLVLSNAAGIRVKGTPIPHLLAMHPEEMLAVCFDNLAAAAPLIPPQVNEEYLLSQYRQRATLASLAWNPDYDPKLELRLGRVQIPTLLVWGEHDRLIAPIYGETYRKLLPHAQLTVLPGTGHMPMFEQPKQWSAAITTFLAGQEVANA